jgi:cytochrome c556
MKNILKHMVAAGLAVAVLGAGISTGPAFADALKDRKAGMKTLSKSNKVIKAYTKGKADLAAAVSAAKKMTAVAKSMPDLFPAGTGMGHGKKTRAKGAIWSDWKKFKAANDAMVVATTNFANWAQLGSASTMKDASKAIGKSCGGCHKPFRGPKSKKKMMMK